MLYISETTVSMDLSNHSSFVLATNNPAKVTEIKHLFNEAGLSLISPADLGLHVSPNETGKTFAENSYQKASETRRLLKKAGHDSYCVVADDSGFEVDALGGLPGVDSALFLGEDATYEERNAHILNEMKLMEDRKARFVCVLTCIFPGGEHEVIRAEVEGEVARIAKGKNGFGYDPIFYVPEFGKTMAELTLDEKNKISHRGIAINRLIQKAASKR